MNLSFSTRGWPELSWEEMLELAIDMGFNGIEVYNLHKNGAMCDRGGPFHAYQIAATVRQLREKKLNIPCFDTSIDLSTDEDAVAILSGLLKLAKEAQVPYVVACALTENEKKVMADLQKLVAVAEENEVTLLMKSSGIYADTARLRRVMDEFASD